MEYLASKSREQEKDTDEGNVEHRFTQPGHGFDSRAHKHKRRG
jgi:hypothetical protein